FQKQKSRDKMTARAATQSLILRSFRNVPQAHRRSATEPEFAPPQASDHASINIFPIACFILVLFVTLDYCECGRSSCTCRPWKKDRLPEGRSHASQLL